MYILVQLMERIIITEYSMLVSMSKHTAKREGHKHTEGDESHSRSFGEVFFMAGDGLQDCCDIQERTTLQACW